MWPVTPLELSKPVSDTLIIGFGILSDLLFSLDSSTSSPGKLKNTTLFNYEVINASENTCKVLLRNRPN